MYLSKITFIQSRTLVFFLNNSYHMHEDITTISLGGKQDRILYRFEIGEDNSHYCLVQTQFRQEWTEFRKRNGSIIRDIQTKEFNPILLKDEMYIFRMRANPTYQKKDEHNKNIRYRVPNEELISWLQKKFGIIGAKVIMANFISEPPQRTYKKNSPRITHSSILFNGTLEVEDPEKLVEGLKNGIGGGKAFGFGLISLAAHH
jgi:CRISPR system Cascade subunit CasE